MDVKLRVPACSYFVLLPCKDPDSIDPLANNYLIPGYPFPLPIHPASFHSFPLQRKGGERRRISGEETGWNGRARAALLYGSTLPTNEGNQSTKTCVDLKLVQCEGTSEN